MSLLVSFSFLFQGFRGSANPDPPFCVFFVSCAFLVSFLPSLFSQCQGHLGGSKKRSFDEKNVGRKFHNRGTEPFLGQKSAEKGKKAEKLRFFRLTHAFLGKKHGKGDQGREKPLPFWGFPKFFSQKTTRVGGSGSALRAGLMSRLRSSPPHIRNNLMPSSPTFRLEWSLGKGMRRSRNQ